MYRINIQCETDFFVPESSQIRKWAKQALTGRVPSAEITIRIVDQAEMTQLNESYRHKKGPTNVLSFPYEDKHEIGDIVICAEVVNKEAKEQNKTPDSHWAHMIVHGVLHLLGYDHQEQKEAEQMD